MRSASLGLFPKSKVKKGIKEKGSEQHKAQLPVAFQRLGSWMGVFVGEGGRGLGGLGGGGKRSRVDLSCTPSPQGAQGGRPEALRALPVPCRLLEAKDDQCISPKGEGGAEGRNVKTAQLQSTPRNTRAQRNAPEFVVAFP